MKTLEFISRQSKTSLITLALLQIIIIATLDYAVGKEISVRFLYFVPLTMLTWYLSLQYGIIFSVLCAVTKIYVDYLSGVYYSTLSIYIWEWLIESAILAAYVIVLYKLRLTMESLKKRNAALKKANEIKNEFLSIAAHDLKNPLANIMGLASLINEDANLSRGEISELSWHILTTSEKMSNLVTDILNNSYVEEEQQNIVLETFDICLAAQNAIKQSIKNADGKNIRIRFQKDAESIFVFADIEHTLRVLDNLISNAIKFSPPGREVWVRIKKLKQNNLGNKKLNVIIEVQDEGQGFTEEDKGKLFGKFVKLSARPTAGENSTGMGLFIVKKFVEAMHGKVWCESKEGKGAKFIVALMEGKS